MRTTVLHVSRKLRNHPCNIHPLKWMAAFERFWPRVIQRWVHCDPPAPQPFKPDIVVLHALNQRPHLVSKYRKAYRKAKIVGLSYNHLWWSVEEHRKSKECIAFQNCDLVFGRMPPGTELPATINWRDMDQLIDDTIFNPGPGKDSRAIDVVKARGWNKRKVYWPEVAVTAVNAFSNTLTLDGSKDVHAVAEVFKASKAVICLREDSGPAYTTVEAALCGAIPLVSDCPALLQAFPERIGAKLVRRNSEEAIQALNEILNMDVETYSEWQTRNYEYFKTYTARYQAPKIIAELEKLLGRKPSVFVPPEVT